MKLKRRRTTTGRVDTTALLERTAHERYTSATHVRLRGGCRPQCKSSTNMSCSDFLACSQIRLARLPLGAGTYWMRSLKSRRGCLDYVGLGNTRIRQGTDTAP